MEVTQAKENALKLKKDFQVAEKQFNSYQDYLLPTLIKTAQSKMERCLMIADEAKKASGFKIGKAMADLNRIQQELKDYEEIYKTAQSELEKTTTLAPQPGLVVLKESFREGEMRKPRVGDIVLQNQPILFLPDVSFMMAKTLIREVDLNKIEVGKPVLIQVDAYPDKTFRGKVDIIGVLAERRPELPQGEKYFKVNISLIESDQNLRPGMTCRIKIEAQKLHGNTLTIPVHAAFEIGGKKYCYIVHPYGFEQREIVLGIQNDELVQVLKGVQEREKISLIQPPAEKVNKTTLLNPPAKK
jgi:HlyD family secretion protein